MSLLLDRGGLRVALGHDEPPQRPAVFARHFLPGRLPLVIAERDGAVRLGLGEEDAPAVLRHPEVPELRPPLRVHADGGAEVHVLGLVAVRPHVLPPLEEFRLPFLQRPQEPAVVLQGHVVGDPLQIIGRRHHTLLRSYSLRSPVP